MRTMRIVLALIVALTVIKTDGRALLLVITGDQS